MKICIQQCYTLNVKYNIIYTLNNIVRIDRKHCSVKEHETGAFCACTFAYRMIRNIGVAVGSAEGLNQEVGVKVDSCWYDIL